jgi:hypothetical protein
MDITIGVSSSALLIFFPSEQRPDDIRLTLYLPCVANCYDFFATAHGIPLVALSTSPSARADIYIPSDLAPFAREYQAIDPSFYTDLNITQLAGARVTKIDGQDVWTRLEGLADQAGVYQDKQQRLNSLFASPIVQYGAW